MKKLWLLFPALLLTAGLIFMGCGDGGGGGKEETGPIKWSLSQDGEEDADELGTKTTENIIITFDRNVTGLVGTDITLSTGNVTRGRLSGSGKVWSIAVTEVNAGNVSVEISKDGIEPGPKSIRVIKEGTKPPILYTAVADGEAGTTSSTKITFTFDKDVTGLTANEITITPAGNVVKGAVTGSEKVWVLALTAVNQEGEVAVKITKEGIDAGNTLVTIHMAPITGYQFYFDAEAKMYFYFEDYLEAEPEAGKIYDIKLDIGAFDSSLVGCHFGGQIYGEVEDDEDFELAGWANGNPDTVAATSRAYTWRLKVKDTISDDVGKAYFQLMAQVPAWGNGIEDAEEVGFNATVTIAEYVPPNLVHYEEITINPGEESDGGDYEWTDATYKGKLTPAKTAEIQAVDGVLRVYITGTISGSYQAGYGIGRVGPDADDGAQASPINVPGDAPKSPSGDGDTYAFFADFPIGDIVLDSGCININVWTSGVTITGVEVWVLAEED